MAPNALESNVIIDPSDQSVALYWSLYQSAFEWKALGGNPNALTGDFSFELREHFWNMEKQFKK